MKHVIFLILLLITSDYALSINNDQALIEHVNRNDTKALKLALDESFRNNKTGKTKFINKQYKFGNTLLMMSIKNSNTNIADFLLRNGANPNIQDLGGATPLHIASRNSDTGSVNLLISFKADINKKDAEGYTPLMRAVDSKSVEIVSTLVKSGANIQLKNNYKNTAIDLKNLIRDKETREKIEKELEQK